MSVRHDVARLLRAVADLLDPKPEAPPWIFPYTTNGTRHNVYVWKDTA